MINDLTTDQRVHRICTTLKGMGFEVLLIGRQLSASKPIEKREYETIRFKLPFERSFLFYVSYNLRLFFFLLFKKTDALLANDSDTLFANFLVSKIRRLPLIYDAHEYFTGVPELKHKPINRTIWKLSERLAIPFAHVTYTVNSSVAALYESDNARAFSIVRNMPFKLKSTETIDRAQITSEDNAKIIIYQGAVNMDRGLEEAIDAMHYIKTNAILLIVGIGDILDKLKSKVINEQLTDKVVFVGQVHFAELTKYTLLANVGLCIEKSTNLNYTYSLPNKFFDYIQCNVPILSSGVKEVRKIMEKYDIGMILDSHSPEHIAELLDKMLNNHTAINNWKEQLKVAADEFCWEKEQIRLIELLKAYAG